MENNNLDELNDGQLEILNGKLNILKKIYNGEEEILTMIKETESTIKNIENHNNGVITERFEYKKPIFEHEPLIKDNSNKIPYRQMYDANFGHFNEVSTNYLNKRITYGELIKNIDKTAKSLTAIGVKKNEIVSICMPTTLESIYLFYALNKIGAVSCMIDPRKSTEEIIYCINNVASKHLFIIDQGAERIENNFNKTTLNNIFKVTPVESLPSIIRMMYNAPLFFQGSSKNTWRKFMSFGDENIEVLEDDYEPNKLGTIEYTSGTTGAPKGVEITNEAICGITQQYDLSGMKHSRGDRFYNGIPIFLAFGEAIGIQLPYVFGMENIVNPQMDINKIVPELIKYSPHHMSFTPAFYESMLDHKKFSNYDMSMVKTMGVGADSMTPAKKREFNQKAFENGSKVGLTMGYGNTENNSAFSTETYGYFKLGSSGVCMDGNEIVIVDDNGKILPPNVSGRVILFGKHAMKQYYNNDEENRKAYTKIEDGRIGMDLGDVGYKDEDSFIFIKGRKKDCIAINNQTIIWPTEIEMLVATVSSVNHCAVARTNLEGKQNPCIYVVRRPEFSIEDVRNEIESKLSDFYSLYGMTMDIKFIKKIPLTENGKTNRALLSGKDALQSVEMDIENVRLKK